MGRKKVKPIDRVVKVVGYVKKRHAARVQSVIDKEIKTIQYEEVIRGGDTIQDNKES